MTEDGKRQPGRAPALRMAVIAFLSYNITISALFGTFSVMLAPVVQRMGVPIEMAALAMPAAIVGNAAMASVAGVLMSRYSLRLMFLLGAVMCSAAFVLLAASDSFAVYIAVYGLLLGPGITMVGTVGPATLVTRWFTDNRGLALGLVHLPVIYATMPIVSNWSYETYGVTTTYLALAAAIAVIVIPAVLFIKDPPPDPNVAAMAGQAGSGAMTIPQLLAKPRFWLLIFAAATVGAGATTVGSALIPMAASWGIDRSDAAILASTTAGVGIIGSALFGWIADRFGGERGLAIMTLGAGILCGAMLLHPPFPVLLVIIGLYGMCGAGTVPNLSRAIADTFGAASFSRALGLFSTLSLPVTICLVPALPALNTMTGSFSPGLILLISVYGLGFVCALVTAVRPGSARAVRRVASNG